MARKTIKIILANLTGLFLVIGCTVSPTGRHQLALFPTKQMAEMGNTSYAKIKQETPISEDQGVNQYVQCIVNALTAVIPAPPSGDQWQVTVFQQDQTVNAFALPGGNIGVYTGILKVAKNADQLAAVIGHELGHVIAQHGNARLSTQYATQTGLELIQVLTRGAGGAAENQLMALLGVGAQVGITLPFSRADESEADLLGLRYMAEAGFDPSQSIVLWQNMTQVEHSAPSEFLSTHPSNQNRIKNLERHLPEAMELYQQALTKGKRLKCNPPKGGG
ncbi:peptidase M48 Ste24p [Candidatus Nitrosoglobus terrae]|uniref:Peptidase M48 Ste24p n=2 Tax=Candidatus Nitrosoglobus terrae TaxID=1630141 RepID=A0A1Q2SNG3_9GAMM|nr:peptidase M48 Ste24p [Candidatus Nitrosoglobus terrae]